MEIILTTSFYVKLPSGEVFNGEFSSLSDHILMESIIAYHKFISLELKKMCKDAEFIFDTHCSIDMHEIRNHWRYVETENFNSLTRFFRETYRFNVYLNKLNILCRKSYT